VTTGRADDGVDFRAPRTLSVHKAGSVVGAVGDDMFGWKAGDESCA